MKYLYVFLIVVFTILRSNATPGSRIVGGDEAAEGQFPWMAAIYVTSSTGTTTFCGGSLISPQFVITAAHCVMNGASFTVYLGSNSLSATDQNRVIISTTALYVNEDYEDGNYDFDIALVDLQTQVPLNDNITPISLRQLFFAGGIANVTVSGWGESTEGSQSLSDNLKYVTVEPLTTYDCSNIYGLNFTICGATYNEGICVGDLGSPMVFFAQEPQLIGIASFLSSEGCVGDSPAGYSPIYWSFDWITTTAELL